MKIKLTSALLVIFVLFFTACDDQTSKAVEIKTSSIKQKKERVKVTKYTLTTTTGKTITFEGSKGLMSSKELEGKMILINFWAPWCKPCLKEMPTFVELQEKYKDNFVIVGVLFNQKKSTEELAVFMEKFKMNFPVTVGPENAVMAKGFDDVQMIPESFLYTKEGLYVEKFIGEISKSKLENHIKSSIK